MHGGLTFPFFVVHLTWNDPQKTFAIDATS